MLAVLVEKTRGNLTEREQKLLQTALFNLRMMFLEITNSIAAQATKAPKPGFSR
jgi:PIN domain nuclease of toxin-antitoxin system